MSEDFNEYNEDDAIAYIRNGLGEEKANLYSDDAILDVIEAIFDYYEARGFFDITEICDEEDVVDLEALSASVIKRIGKNRGEKVAPEDIPAVCALELEYENSLNDFQEMRLLKHIILAIALATSAQAVAQDVDIDTEYKEDRGMDKVRNFFKGNKGDDNKQESKKHTDTKQKKETRTSKSGKSDNYSLEQIYELSLDDNLKIPNLGSQKTDIRKYQNRQAKKLYAAIEDGK